MRSMSLILILLANGTLRADPGTEFFERKIRPLLVANCFECHSSRQKKPKGGLNLETKAGWQKGGESGPAIVPGKPGESRLLAAVRYSKPGLKMPPRGRLAPELIADLEKWIAMGAPDPRSGTATAASELDVEAGRQFWAYQPTKKHALPQVKRGDFPVHRRNR